MWQAIFYGCFRKFILESFASKKINFIRSESVAKHVEQKEIVEFVRADKVFRFCLIMPFSSAGINSGLMGVAMMSVSVFGSLGRHGHRQTMQQDILPMFWDSGIYSVHRHVVAIVCGPSQCQFRQVARSYHQSCGLVCDIHQHLRSFARLGIFVNHIVNVCIMSDVGKMLQASLFYGTSRKVTFK